LFALLAIEFPARSRGGVAAVLYPAGTLLVAFEERAWRAVMHETGDLDYGQVSDGYAVVVGDGLVPSVELFAVAGRVSPMRQR
jgi:hypothetical protein